MVGRTTVYVLTKTPVLLHLLVGPTQLDACYRLETAGIGRGKFALL